MDLEQEFESLEKKAMTLLELVGSSNEPATYQQLQDLEWYANQLSKLAYGNNRPELVVGQMYNLISWCDHIHEEGIKQEFAAALCTEPLVYPEWSRS